MDSSGGGAYFGANDIASEVREVNFDLFCITLSSSAQGNYYFMDGTPVTYTRWRFNNGKQDQPRVSNADEQDCLRLRTDSYWDDARCDRASTDANPTKFVCERKPTCGSTGTITFGIGKK